MKLSDALKEKLLDVRVRDKFLAQGKINKEMVDEYLRSLPEESEKVVQVQAEIERPKGKI